MSHIVTIQTQVRDPESISHACRRLHLPEPEFATVTLFSTTATGWAVQLPEWTYPVVCDVEQGQLQYDNFGGRWGAQHHLDRFLQVYAVERAKLEARKQGYSATEQALADGSIKVTIEVGA
ncbi:MAG: hypothetical protein JWN70_1638 [Planctomycetaceae bacterium]|nr:hypothetical protein [Planctomycetaceae bacterium]